MAVAELPRQMADVADWSAETKSAEAEWVIADERRSCQCAATAISNIIDATQSALDAAVGGHARTWLRKHSVN
ncbi:hypothetical protein MMMB2_1519 [Mycobacterium marinum MB2]|nr:hypothetical protein MMMB2_1519 [Mycobacterium marinum MB2]